VFVDKVGGLLGDASPGVVELVPVGSGTRAADDLDLGMLLADDPADGLAAVEELLRGRKYDAAEIAALKPEKGTSATANEILKYIASEI
jgi:hypothetical protein